MTMGRGRGQAGGGPPSHSGGYTGTSPTLPGPTPVPSPAPPAPESPAPAPTNPTTPAPLPPGVAPTPPNIPFDLSIGMQAGFQRAGQPRYEYNAFPVLSDQNGNPLLYYWYLIQHDVSGGLNKTYGEYDHDFDRSRASTLWAEENVLCLPPLTTTADTPDPAGNLAGMHWAQIFSRLIIACGSTDDACLFKTTSATDPTPVAITGVGTAGRPGSAFTCAEPVVLNGATTARSLVLGRTGAAPIRVSDANGTIAATGHANLNPTWGVWWYNDVVGFYANNGLWTLSVSSEISAAPTQTQSNLKDGGWVMGLQRFTAGVYNEVRVFGCIPLTDNTSGALLSGSEAEVEVWHWNVQGLDMVPLSFAPILNKVTWACIYAQGILATDGERWAYHNGALVSDLYEFEDRVPDSDKEFRLRGAHIVGQDLYPRVNEIASSGGTGNTDAFSEKFDFDNWAFNAGSDVQSVASTGVFGVLPGARGLPWDINTRYLFTHEDGKWRYWQFPNPGERLFNYRKTTGAQAATGRQFATSGEYESPAFQMPKLHGMTKSLARATFVGLLESSGTPTTEPKLTLSVRALKEDGTESYQTAEFTPLDLQDVGAIREFDPPVAFDQLQYKLKADQQTGGTDPTRTNMNLLPIKLEGWAWPEPLARPTQRPHLIGRLISWLRGK